MIHAAREPQCCYEFEGEILVLHHPSTISPKYQAMVHCGSIRQTASIIRMSSECLRTGDKAQVLFRFVKHPEYLKEGQRWSSGREGQRLWEMLTRSYPTCRQCKERTRQS